MSDLTPRLDDMPVEVLDAALDAVSAAEEECMADIAPYAHAGGLTTYGKIRAAFPTIARWVAAQARAKAFREAADLIEERARKDGVLGPTETDLDASILRGLADEAEGLTEGGER